MHQKPGDSDLAGHLESQCGPFQSAGGGREPDHQRGTIHEKIAQIPGPGARTGGLKAAAEKADLLASSVVAKRGCALTITENVFSYYNGW